MAVRYSYDRLKQVHFFILGKYRSANSKSRPKLLGLLYMTSKQLHDMERGVESFNMHSQYGRYPEDPAMTEYLKKLESNGKDNI